MVKKQHIVYRAIPDWVPAVYAFLAIVTVPWTFFLAVRLPVHHISSHWDVAWVGLDTGLIIMLSATAVCAYLKSNWIVMAATATATLLTVDAWFDVWTARGGREFSSALVLAIFIELPLSVITLTIAARVMSRHIKL
jgi:hypothetical protein